MQRLLAALVILGSMGSLEACGEKLNPGTADTDTTGMTGGGVTNPTPQNPNGTGSDPNQVTNPNGTGTNPNGTVTNPNTTPVTPAPTPTGLCGTSATAITYTAHISALTSSKCLNCHNVGGNSPPLTNYSQTMAGFKTGGALDQVDSGQMPLGTTLTENQVCLFDTWAQSNYTQ